jgi:hypothetical protein
MKLLKKLPAIVLNLVERIWLGDKAAKLLVPFAKLFMQGNLAHHYFRVWEKCGVHFTPVHFYQPIPDTRSLPNKLWEKDSDLVGVEMNEAVQLDLLQNVFPKFQTEYSQFSATPTEVPYEFYLNNEAFAGADALVAYCMARHFQSRLILEVGSGFSSRLLAQAALRNGKTELICIEPYPAAILTSGFPGLTSLIRKQVQEVDLELFQQLGANDILFIDSSHVVKCGGDVNYLFLAVLPRLRPGVVIQIHDIFLPQEYPKAWIMEQHLFWTEQYLLQAFLTFNSEFEVLFANAFMGAKYLPEMQATFPQSPWRGGASFWLRRKSKS